MKLYFDTSALFKLYHFDKLLADVAVQEGMNVDL